MSVQSLNHTLEEFDIEESNGIIECTVLTPAFEKNNVAVVLVSSDEYAPFASVVVTSVVANASEENNYDIVVLTNDMLLRNRWRIEKIAEGHANVSIRVLDISKMIEGFSFYTWAHFTSNTYYRLLTPDIFANYDKVLYLDSDIVVDHDVAELYHTELRGYYLAAALDTHVVSYCTMDPPLEQRQYNIEVLGMKDPELYFQAGVSLFNVKEIRKDFGEGYLIQEGLNNKLRWLDQDLLNKLFYGKIKKLSNKWNVMVSNIPTLIDEYHLPAELRTEYYNARREPYIVHYVGRSMPCLVTTFTPDLFEYFWKYARMSVFYELLLQKASVDYSEKLAESIRIQLRQELSGSNASAPKKSLFRKLVDFFLPKGTKRRVRVKNFVFKFKKWGKKGSTV